MKLSDCQLISSQLRGIVVILQMCKGEVHCVSVYVNVCTRGDNSQLSSSLRGQSSRGQQHFCV